VSQSNLETLKMSESYAKSASQTGRRKRDHIQINLNEDVTHRVTSGLERFRFIPKALPDLDLAQVDASVSFLGHSLDLPLLISSMTGGTPDAKRINVRLAEVAQAANIAMGLGSLRAAIDDPNLADTFSVRQLAPDILLLANLGAVQLNYGYGLDECLRAVEMVHADALILHLNPIQEALQPEGNTHWSGLLKKIEAICTGLDVPVIAKEVGWGISGATARQLAEAGVAAIDVAGAGGTSWSQVEMHRAQDDVSRRVAAHFHDWGIPTADSLLQVRESVPELPIIASGGLEPGLDVAKVIALGASLAGMAGPFLRAASVSVEQVADLVEEIARTLRIAMFGTGSRDLAALRNAKLVDRSVGSVEAESRSNL
jgi:isopentenyl-diphosphate delta-isomerase